jgi:hypothetical protein
VQADDKYRICQDGGCCQLLDSGEVDADFAAKRRLAFGLAHPAGHSNPHFPSNEKWMAQAWGGEVNLGPDALC